MLLHFEMMITTWCYIVKSYVNVGKRNISKNWWNTPHAMIYGLSLLNPHVLTLGTNSRLKLYHVIKHSNTLIFVLFCSLRNPFLHFWKGTLFVVLVWNVVIFWILHKKRCFGFATYVWLNVWLNGFSSNSAKTIIQSWSSCNKGNKPSPRIWPLSISHGFFNYVTYHPWYMCKFP